MHGVSVWHAWPHQQRAGRAWGGLSTENGVGGDHSTAAVMGPQQTGRGTCKQHSSQGNCDCVNLPMRLLQPVSHSDCETGPVSHSDCVMQPVSHCDWVTQPVICSDHVTRTLSHSDCVMLPVRIFDCVSD